LFGFKWPSQFRYLGIYLGYDKDANYDMNWNRKIDKIKDILNAWGNQCLSFLGSIQVIKSLALPQITLCATILPIPEDVIHKINKLFFTFLWKSNEKVKRIKLIQSLKNGGLNMIDLESYIDAQKAQWINRILNANRYIDNWVQLPLNYLHPFGLDEYSLHINIDKSVEFSEIKMLPSFYIEVIYSFSKAHNSDQTEFITGIRNQYIWGNKFITKNVGKKKSVLFLRNWIRSGIRVISDLRFIDGKLDEQFLYNTIRDKTNIHIEIATVKKALLKYKDILMHNTNTPTTERISTSKAFYTKFIEEKEKNIECYSNYLRTELNINETVLFTEKVYNEKEYKLKEYNFKLLHGILPCNKNLKKWRIKDNDTCDVCPSIQTIKHLLFDCHYVKNIWTRIKNLFNVDVTFAMILGDMPVSQYNSILTLLGFLIYKEWLLHSLDNRNRQRIQDFNFLKAEMQLRIDIYKKCSAKNHLDIAVLEEYIVGL
jgi:hypothetical protein